MGQTPKDSLASDASWERAALAAALDPVVTIDSSGTIHSASDSVYRVLGWTPMELTGKNVSILMPEPHRSAHDGYLVKYHQTGQTNILNRPRRFDAQRKDGSIVPIELCVSRAEVLGTSMPLFVGIIRDMTATAHAERSREEERVRSQQLLAEQTAALQSAHLRLRMADRMASIGTLAAGLGHDMNNVLLPVRARLNALKAGSEAGRLSTTDHHQIEEIAKSVAYLQQLADGLHFLSLDPDTQEDVRGGGATTDLHQWWSHVGGLLSKAVPHHVQVQASIPESLPRIGVAAHRLTQAVLNLVVNAGEAIPDPSQRKRRQGTVRVWADATNGSAGPRVRLGVTDNGSGMTQDVKQRAFEIFFTTKPRGLGTGLGLALVRTIADQAGGKVEIESAPGRGTTVILELPVASRIAPRAHERSRVATISLDDGRASAFIRALLESAGVRLHPNHAEADLWIIDPARTSPGDAQAWVRSRPGARVVLFGRPTAGTEPAWNLAQVLVIEEVRSVESIRSSLLLALAEPPGTP
jgi:PAS domain S-box-containing protein